MTIGVMNKLQKMSLFELSRTESVPHEYIYTEVVVEGGRLACFNYLIDGFIRVLESVHVFGSSGSICGTKLLK